MAAESNSAFHHHQQQQNQGSEMNFPVNYYGIHGGSLNLRVNDCAVGATVGGNGILSTNSLGGSAAIILDSVSGLKHDTGFAVEWSPEEEYKMEQGLSKYANEPPIMRFIKIAASLREKTVRDVALRWSWMTRKRRKQEEQSFGNMFKDHKERYDSSLKNNIPFASPINTADYYVTTNHHDQTDSIALSGTTRHLLEENIRAFGQISANLSTLKWQENIDLLFRTRNNITTVLNTMKSMPGIISQMPPLPVIVNEELASCLFPCSSQAIMFGLSSAAHIKQEPGSDFDRNF